MVSFSAILNLCNLNFFYKEDINIAGKDAAKATNDLRTDAEAFTQKAKDQWTDNYKRTEVALREKSDKSSSHLSALQTLTGWLLLHSSQFQSLCSTKSSAKGFKICHILCIRKPT